jgi:P-type Mg2+ transporter
MRTVLFLVLFVMLASLVLHHPPLESLLFAVALAVGLTPEFLPMIMSVTLAQGAVHMARPQVIVKHLAAIEDFGSMDVLCSDKTGTLTTGTMVLERCLDPVGHPDKRSLPLRGQRAPSLTGALPLRLAALNSVYETGIRSPLGTAILAADQPDTQAYTKVDEIPFDFERRRLSTVVENPSGQLLIAKSAPESMLQSATAYEVTHHCGHLLPQAFLSRGNMEFGMELFEAGLDAGERRRPGPGGESAERHRHRESRQHREWIGSTGHDQSPCTNTGPRARDSRG